MKTGFECRKGCGACCEAISISSALPGHPDGKPAGLRCSNLSLENVCTVHGLPSYPEVCRNLTPRRDMCKESRAEALSYLSLLETLTKP